MVRRRRNLRKASTPKPQAAPTSPAGIVREVIADWVELARPTPTTPVLVTGPSPAGTAAAAEDAGADDAGAEEAGAMAAGDVAAAAGAAAATEGGGLFEPLPVPSPSPPLAAEGAAYVCGAAVLGLAGAVMEVVGSVVAGSVIVGAPETTMVTDGLPGPQAALTVYDPDADGEIVADPLKLI